MDISPTFRHAVCGPEKAKICIAMGKKEMAEAALQKAIKQKMHHFQRKRFEKMLNDLQKK